MPPPEQTRAPDQEHRFPCSNCGADLRFSPGDTELACDFCGSREPIEGLEDGSQDILEIDYLSAINGLDEVETETTRISTCPSCAAQVEFDPAVHATECPFCATPVVTDTGTNRHIKPKGVLPFALPERDAKAAMTKWLGKLWFAPNGLQEYARKGRKLQGIYVPYWTFDAQTQSRYSGQRGTVYYVTQTVMRDGKREQVKVQKVRWTPRSGHVSRFFDDVLVLASRALPKPMTDALEPWDLSELSPYTPEILAGFRAEAYTIALEDGLPEARAYMDRVILRDVKFDIGGDRQQVNRIETDVKAVTFKHILLPIWMAAYKYNGKTYRFVVNGRTGQVQGERPYSTIKIVIAVALGVVIIGTLGFLMALGG